MQQNRDYLYIVLMEELFLNHADLTIDNKMRLKQE